MAVDSAVPASDSGTDVTSSWPFPRAPAPVPWSAGSCSSSVDSHRPRSRPPSSPGGRRCLQPPSTPPSSPPPGEAVQFLSGCRASAIGAAFPHRKECKPLTCLRRSHDPAEDLLFSITGRAKPIAIGTIGTAARSSVKENFRLFFPGGSAKRLCWQDGSNSTAPSSVACCCLACCCLACC